MYILYCWDRHLDYYDWFICHNCWLNDHVSPSDSYWLVPGTYHD